MADQNLEEEQSLQTVDTETEYPIETEPEPNTHRNWPMLAALVVAALAFAVLVVFAGRWVYHKVHHNTVVAPAQTKDLPKPPPSNLKSDSGTSGPAKNTAPSANPSDNLPTTGG